MALTLGWASVQCNRDRYVIFDVMTPDKDQQQNEDNDKYQTNELEMIINEKLWKDEQIKHRRRAKRT
ncbi:unnamed protein product [Rotaria sp. Silwood2]|nr:unnamed protein product [Rotaria sp. Silwood2]